jgi:hypothetical protein
MPGSDDGSETSGDGVTTAGSSLGVDVTETFGVGVDDSGTFAGRPDAVVESLEIRATRGSPHDARASPTTTATRA